MECIVNYSVKNLPISQKKIKEVVFFVLKKLKKDGEISINIVGNKKIQNLNYLYRKKKCSYRCLVFFYF